MGRKPKSTISDASDISPEVQPSLIEPPTPQPFEINNDPGAEKAVAQERISIPLGADGKADFSKMRASTIDKFKKAASDSVLSSSSVGGGSKPVVPDENLMTFEEVAALFDMLGPVEGYAIALIMKVPVAIAMKVFTYTDADKAELVPAAMALANKYGIKQYLGYLEESRFAMVMYKVTTLKLDTLKTLVKEERDYKAKLAMYDAPRPVMQPHEQVGYVEQPPPPPATVSDGFAVIS